MAETAAAAVIRTTTEDGLIMVVGDADFKKRVRERTFFFGEVVVLNFDGVDSPVSRSSLAPPRIDEEKGGGEDDRSPQKR